MNAKNKKGLIAVVVVLAIAGTAYYFISKNKPGGKNLTKSEKATVIISNGLASNYAGLMAFEDAFVDAWYDAAINGKIYVSLGNTINSYAFKTNIVISFYILIISNTHYRYRHCSSN